MAGSKPATGETPDSTLPEKRDDQRGTPWIQVLAVVGGVALYILFGLLLWWLLDRYINPQNSGQKKDLVQALGLIMAGVAGAIGIYFTWRGQRLTQQSLEDTRKNTQENLRITREGQITERFTRAIDQIGATDDKGNKLYEIRLGGIYALERIARESDEDYWPIMEILTAYVRQHAPLKSAKEPAEEGSDEGGQAPDPDIQAIMTILRRRTRSLGHGEPEPLDLSETNLSGASLRKADLTRAELSEANLLGANLGKANLNEADLSQAKHLRQEQLEETRVGDARTKLPPHLKPPAHWGVQTDEHIEGSILSCFAPVR